MNRWLSPTFGATLAAMLYLFPTLPAHADMKNVTESKPLPAKTTPRTQQKTRPQSHKKYKQPNSAFVTLSHCILENKATGWTTDPVFLTPDAADGATGFSKEACGFGDATVGRPLFPAGNRAQPVLGRSVSPGLRNSLSGERGDYYGPETGFGTDLIHADSDQQRTLANGTGKGAGSPFAYSYKADSLSLNAGIAYIRDIGDSNGISKAFEQPGVENVPDQVSGLNLNLGASFRAFTLTGGYIRAVDKFTPAPLFLNESPAEPSAWNGELAYSTELLDKETVLAIGYLKSAESLKLYLPEQRYITKASMALFDSTTLSLEYYMDKDFATEKGSTDEDGYGITTKIGFGF